MGIMRHDVTLGDAFTARDGLAYVTGTQALLVMALQQKRLDERAGLNTAGFISGYRGSPLSSVDTEAWKAERHLADNAIRFQPGVNEDLAATAVWGTQQVALDPQATVQGVFGMWYGKGAGLDRCGDVIRHAHGAGASAHGGVLVVTGDDHALKSSSQAYHSEPTFIDLMIPVLYPADIAEMITYGLYGWAMSRFSGAWVGLKVLAELVNSTTAVDLGLDDFRIVLPDAAGLSPDRHIRWPDPWPAVERRMIGAKLPAARAFARANAIDRAITSAPDKRLAIVTAGKSYVDVVEALRTLGLSPADAARRGVSLYKVGMPWPLDTATLGDFLRGHETVLIAEEKRDVIEAQLRTTLYDWPDRPRIIGRRDEAGQPLLPDVAEASPDLFARIIGRRLTGWAPSDGIAARLAELDRAEAAAQPAILTRGPYFCSGCPHNSSTVVPEGSRALGGVGCHYMAVDMERDTTTFTQMGGEGATWIGAGPYSRTGHVFVNMGEGTYFHSGLLAIRAAVAAGATMTYKILFNDAVAMTGGQPVDGQMTVPQLSRQLRAEGIARIEIVADDPGKYGIGADFAPGIRIRPRSELDQVQRELREVAGVSALIYDQVCATEKRRRRKRGTMERSPTTVVINEAVCEGCGDCGSASNCLSLVPVETELGRKRQVDQASCNQDTTCLKGFCPSFVTLDGARPRRRAAEDVAAHDLPLPAIGDGPADILVTGVGGAGVVTIGAVLGMAAHLEGRPFVVHDRLGMAQKFGSVWSHVRIGAAGTDIASVRIPARRAQLLIGGDLGVAAEPASLNLIDPERALIVANTNQTITGAFTRNPDFDFKTAGLLKRLREAAGKVETLDATGIAAARLGDAIGANMMLLGYAWQRGHVPLSLEAIDRALLLNGTAVEANRRAFALGRQLAVAPPATAPAPVPAPLEALDEIIAHRSALLTAYQDKSYAARYRGLVEVAAAAERLISGVPGPFARAVARNLARLMAYKDEYEVARLHADPAFARMLAARFEGGRLRYHLAPPLFAPRDPVTGRPRKIAFGPWMRPVFGLLARLKGLRGTVFDPFGHHPERRAERRLVADYETLIRDLSRRLDQSTLDIAVRLARLPEQIRGYGHVKEAAIERAAAARADLLAELAAAPPGAKDRAA